MLLFNSKKGYGKLTATECLLFLLAAIFPVCLSSLHIVWIICVQTLGVPSFQPANSCVMSTNHEYRKQNVPLVQELQQLHPQKRYNDKKYSQSQELILPTTVVPWDCSFLYKTSKRFLSQHLGYNVGGQNIYTSNPPTFQLQSL